MRYTEYVLQRLGIMPDGCPGKVLLEGIINSFSRPLAKLLKLYTVTNKDGKCMCLVMLHPLRNS
jgi:hypothetical protein